MSGNAMEKCFQYQIERIDRLMRIVEADNPYELASGLQIIDIMMFTCQSMWHLKDWILKDPEFGAKDCEALRHDIHSSSCLLICADLANGSKHLSLDRPKIGGLLSEDTGVHIDTSKGICHELFFVVCPDELDEFNGMEIRTLLRRCRNEWECIINKHYLSKIDDMIRNHQ